MTSKPKRRPPTWDYDDSMSERTWERLKLVGEQKITIAHIELDRTFIRWVTGLLAVLAIVVAAVVRWW